MSDRILYLGTGFFSASAIWTPFLRGMQDGWHLAAVFGGLAFVLAIIAAIVKAKREYDGHFRAEG
jgi:F0F1-type ATP synthase assembly protein I